MRAAFASHLLCAAAALEAWASVADMPAWAMEASLRDSQLDVPAQLLQMKAAPRWEPVAGAMEQSEEFQKTLPIGWLHVPKTGTAFLNTLIHLPGVCPTFPDNLAVCPDGGQRDGCVMADVLQPEWTNRTICPGLADADWGQAGLKGRIHLNEARGNYMTMLRDPEEQTLSAFRNLHYRLDVEPDFERLNNPCGPFGGLPEGKVPNITEFAIGYAGCATKMLTRAGCPCSETAPPTDAEVQDAVERLHTDFSFVGMTDEWDLSICLLSAQFRVPCLPAMMSGARHNGVPDSEKYDIAPLQGIKDPYDRAVFEEGKKIFRERLEKYKVTREWCEQTCWKDAGMS